MKKYETRYYIAHGNLYPVEVRREERADGRVIWRERGGGHTYADRHIRGLNELASWQKRAMIVREYERQLRAIDWDIAKDPTLACMRRKWRKDAREKRDAALAAI